MGTPPFSCVGLDLVSAGLPWRLPISRTWTTRQLGSAALWQALQLLKDDELETMMISNWCRLFAMAVCFDMLTRLDRVSTWLGHLSTYGGIHTPAIRPSSCMYARSSMHIKSTQRVYLRTGVKRGAVIGGTLSSSGCSGSWNSPRIGLARITIAKSAPIGVDGRRFGGHF